MALIKEDYGLIYNDDGSLCVTVRDDDVPFQGVKSFAVEKSTENILPVADTKNSFNPLDFNLNPTGWFGGTGDIPEITVDTLTNFEGFKYVKHIRIVGHGSGWVNTLKPSIRNTANPGESYTTSAYCKMVEWKNVSGILSIDIVELRNYNSDISDYDQRMQNSYSINDGNAWKRYITTIENTSNMTAYIQSNFLYLTGIGEGDIIDLYFAYPQMEQKPFATSFVDGSRPNGKLSIDTKISDYNNFVISYWKKPYWGRNNIDDYNSVSIGAYPPQNGNGYIEVGKDSNNDRFRLIVYYENGNRLESYSNTFDFEWYLNNWHHEVFYINGNIVKFYVDGILWFEETLISNLGNLINKTFNILEDGQIISNLFIGEYKDKNGNVIWTDEYIQGLYEAKKPFNKNL